MTTTVVLPSIVPEFTAACVATMRFLNRTDTDLLVVQNTPERNHGVAGSWNLGIERMYANGHDWLVICSAGVRFGPAGGNDFLEALDTPRDYPHAIAALEAGNELGWHLLAFHRTVFQKVGYFDENFHPAYREDNDLSYRIQLAYGIDSRAPGFVGPLWPKVEVDATLAEVAHGIKKGGVTVDLVAQERYYTAKWGADSPHETFTSPYDSGNPVSFWRSTGRVLA